MNWYLEVLKKYAVFNGRAGRKEYWYFVLFNIVFYILFGAIDRFIGSFNTEAGIGLFSSLYSLAVFTPGLAVTVRRLHDTDRSGWWLLIGLIPIIGALVLIVFTAQDSKAGDNK
ncbi:MAG: DUF805 domain-containing protein [Desulfobacterales bacterium]